MEAIRDEPVLQLQSGDERTWKPLRLFNLYRLTLAGFFVVLSATANLPQPLGSADPELFHYGALTMLALAVVFSFLVQWRWPAFEPQVFAQVLADIGTLMLMIHASGGIASGLGILLVVSVAGASLLTAGRMAGLFAAMASIGVLTEQVLSHLDGVAGAASYPRAGMLGGAIFATALLAHTLAYRIRESEALAARRGVDLENMAELAGYVIQRLDSGVVVVDPDGKLRLMNSAAREFFGSAGSQPSTLTALNGELAERVKRWRAGDVLAPMMRWNGRELYTRLVRIGRAEHCGTLIFVEDASTTLRQAQQLKLASLGRLTASIAHEIRNPLGAVSHAAELLHESPQVDEQDNRLVEIILEHSGRVNGIIHSVLQIGRRENTRPVELPIEEWLRQFIDDYQLSESSGTPIRLQSDAGTSATIHFDPVQLHQIVWNLCENGLRHASAAAPELELAVGREHDDTVWLEIRDNGHGLTSAEGVQVFEPFYTTEPGGTGLGLYIARELAQLNGARLEHRPGDRGTAFRLTFANAHEFRAA